jgi:site-specific DNA recombinase
MEQENITKTLSVQTQDKPLDDNKGRNDSIMPAFLSQRIAQNSNQKSQPLRVAVYLRVSTREQAQKKTSIADQSEICNKIIKENGWILYGEYKDEGVSGHLTEERNGLQSMLRDGREHKFDLILIKDYDRFARNKDAAGTIRQELKELGIQVYAINTPIEPKLVSEYDPDADQIGTMMETVSDMKSDIERKQIMLRMKDGKLNVAKAGKIPNNVPYGYRVIRTIEETKIKREIVVVEEEAARVTFIYNEYARGLGDRKIAIEMNKKGWRTKRGGQWTITGIRYILANPTYIGKIWWGWRHAEYRKTKEWRRRGKMGFIGPGDHKPIIDPPLYQLVQEIRAGRIKTAKGGAERSFGLLTGIAKCIRCGSGVGYQKRFHKRSNKNPGWKDTITHEYICTGYKYKGICSQRVMSATKLEGEVLDHVKNLYAHPKVQERIIYDGKNTEEIDREKEIARLEREIATESVKMQRQNDVYERGIIQIEEYEANIKRIKEETVKSRMERDRLLSLSSRTAQKVSAIQKLVASFKDFDTIWNAMQLDEKKMILRSIIREIRAGNDHVEIDFIL